MLVFLLALAVLNLGLGFALAIWLEPQPLVQPRRLAAEAPPSEPEPASLPAVESAAVETPPPEPKTEESPIPPPEEPAAPIRPEVETVVVTAATEPPLDLPNEWLDLLADAGEVNSFVEASAQVLKLEVGKYRRQLVEVEAEIRRTLSAATLDQLGQWTARIVATNSDWLARQSEVAGLLSQHATGLPEWRDASVRLSELLDQQTAQIETTTTNLAALETCQEPAVREQRLLREIAKLVNLAHALRDRMHETLLAIVSREGRLDQLDRRLQVDGDGLRNRTGIERVFQDWWRDDPTRTRPLSVVAIDVDRLGHFNERMGTLAGDALLNALAQLLASLVRVDRGFDVASRISGQQFVLFLGDTGPRGATSAAERIRQTLAATSFDCRDHEVAITISCGVTEVLVADTTASLFARLQASLALAKQTSRNCTILDEGAGPEPVNPPVYEVKARVIRLDDSSTA